MSFHARATSPVPAQFVVDVTTHGDGADFVIHTLAASAAKVHVACTRDGPPSSAALQCRSNGRIVMTAIAFTVAGVRIFVYINPPPSIEGVLSEVLSAAKSNHEVDSVHFIGRLGRLPTEVELSEKR
jgi:hypothetical protein